MDRDDRLIRVIDHLLERLDELQAALATEKAYTESLQKIIEGA